MAGVLDQMDLLMEVEDSHRNFIMFGGSEDHIKRLYIYLEKFIKLSVIRSEGEVGLQMIQNRYCNRDKEYHGN